jgi:hypothetical protein
MRSEIFLQKGLQCCGRSGVFRAKVKYSARRAAINRRFYPLSWPVCCNSLGNPNFEQLIRQTMTGLYNANSDRQRPEMGDL